MISSLGLGEVPIFATAFPISIHARIVAPINSVQNISQYSQNWCVPFGLKATQLTREFQDLSDEGKIYRSHRELISRSDSPTRRKYTCLHDYCEKTFTRKFEMQSASFSRFHILEMALPCVDWYPPLQLTTWISTHRWTNVDGTHATFARNTRHPMNQPFYGICERVRRAFRRKQYEHHLRTTFPIFF